MAEFDPDKFLAEDNVAESKSFDPDKFLSETDPDVKKKGQTEPTQDAPLQGLGGVSEESTPPPSVGQGVLRDVEQTQPTGEEFISQASDPTRQPSQTEPTRVSGAGGTFVTKEDAAPIIGYEENQKALSDIDKQISNNQQQGRFIDPTRQKRLKELQAERDILKKRSDQLISETNKDVSGIISKGIGDDWEDFTNELGDIDVSKIGDFARQEALKYGLPEDGYFSERVKNAAKSKVEMEKISPTTESFFLGGERRSPEGITRSKEVQLPGYDSPSTVLMSSYGPNTIDGKYAAFPSLFPKDPKRQTSNPNDWIVAENDDEAYRIAKERGEVLYFDTQKEADSMAEGSWKKRKGTYEEMYGVKPGDDAENMLSREDTRKALGLSKLDAEFSSQMAQLNSDISRSSTEDIERISEERYGQPIEDYVSQLGQGYESESKAIESRYSSLIQDGNFVGSQDQYDAYQKELQSVREVYEGQVNDVVSQNMRDVAAVNNKANRRFNRQRDEILQAYKTEYTDKAKGINPILQERYQKAYNKALDKAMEVENVKKESRAMITGKLATGSFTGGLLTSTYLSGFSSNMATLTRSMGMSGEFWEQAAIDFDTGKTELDGFKDWMDPIKAAKSVAYTFGGMTPTLAVSIPVGAATGGLGGGAMLSTLASGAAGWGIETMSITQDAYDQKFKETGSVAKAEEAAAKSLKGQVIISPLYAFEMLPFFGDVGQKLAKIGLDNVAARFVTGGAVETVTEISQEYSQQLMEQAISDDKELSEAINYASIKGFGHTVSNVALTTIATGGLGSAVQTTKTSKEDMAKALAMKVNIGELTETAMEQKMLAMTVNAGEKFSKAFVATQLMEGNITEEQAERATSAIESSVATIEKGKEYNLDNKNNYILATLDLKLKAAKAKAESESDPMMKGIAESKVKKIEKQAQKLMETGNVDVALVTYPDGSFDILTHDEARLAMSKDEFMESFSSGDLKVEAMGESQAKLMSELQEKSKAMEPEAAPVEEKPTPRVFETPTDEKYAVVNEGKGEGDRVLTRQEYDEYVAPAQEEKTKEDKLSKDKDRNERIEKALAILEPIASSREELTVDQLTEVSEILGEELAGELISDQISKAPDAVDLYNLLDDNKVKIDDTQTTEQEGVGTEEQVGKEGAGQVQEPEVSQEEGATDTVLQEEEELESTTEEELDAIDRELSDQGVVEGALTGRSRKRKVVKAVRNGIKAISKALPKVKIKLYETQDEYEQATGRKGRGFYNFKEKSISINLESANARTVAHEIFHAFLLDKISTNEEAASISAKLLLELNKVEGDNAKLVKELTDFASMYEEEGIGVMTEEILAEYIGKIAENYDSLSAKGKRAVREFVNSMLELIGKANPETKEFLPSRVSGNEVVDMLVGIGERVAAGEVIEAEDVKLMDPDYLGLDIGDGTRSRAGNRQQLEELFLSDKKPKIKSLTDVAKFVESWAKDNTLFDKDIKDIPDDQIVKEFADHISAELIAWDKVRESEYVSFYDDDIKDRTNPTLQKYAMEEYGRPLTDSEVKLYHMVSSFASPSANPTFDSWKGFDIFDRWMKTGELSGYSDKMATEWEWTTSKTGKRVRKDTGIPKMDKEGNPVRSKVSPGYSQTGLDKFNLVLEKFNGDLDKTMDWFTSKHSYSEIAKILDLPEKGSKAKKENEYISKEDGAIGIFGITGAKLGSYILNRFGNFSTVTKDMWYARTMARLAGEDLISVNKKTKEAGAIKTPWAESSKEGKRKRKLADKAFKIVADQRGTSPAMIQEQIWDFEKRLYEKLGAGEDASYTSDGLNRGIEEKKKAEKSPAGREQKTSAEVYSKIGMNEGQVEKWKENNRKNFKMPHPKEAIDAVKKYAEGKISLKKYNEVIKKVMPIVPYDLVPIPASLKDIALSLRSNKLKSGIIGLNASIKEGEMVSSRLDIPAYMDFGIYVDTIHGPKGKGVLGYGQSVALKNVTFGSSAIKALKVALGEQSKSPFAVMEGAYKNESTESAVKRAEEALKSNEWVQVGFNPYRHAYFYDKANSNPVVSAKEVIQVGPLVMAKGVVYGEALESTDKKTGEIVRFQKDESNPLGNYEMQKNTLKGKIKATIDFKNRYGKYFSISKIFSNENHLNNYIDFMERKGNKEVGVKRVVDVPDVSPTQPFAGREQKNAPLFSGKNKNIIDLANKYIAKKGLAAPEDTEIRKLNTKYSKAMADVYEAAKNTPLDEDVQKAYKALAKESKEQFEALKKDGYVVELWDGANQPYDNSTEMLEDLKDNKHLYVFSTEEGFGESGITAKNRRENPMLADSGYKDANGKKLLLNDLFRFVHDTFGHGKLGNSFGPVGEENAWYVHSQMFSPEARRAMTSETRGQNSWVNFGPQLRDKDGSLPKMGDKNYVPMSQRDFAPQKNFLFPEEYVFDRPNTQGRFEGREQKVKVDKSTIKKNVVAAVDFIKKAALKVEDGVTLNIDGTRYDGGGLVVPISSMNVEQGTLKPSSVADFVERNKGKLSNDTFKLGLYKFPKESTVSIDLSVIVPNENRKLALSIGKKLNQESLFDLDSGENIKTGGTGQNTVELTDEQAAELATSLSENKEPEFLGRESKTKEKKRSFLDKNIEKLKFASNLSESVFEDPEAFYEPQVLAEIKENAKYMSDSELIEAMSLDGLNSIMNISGSTNTNMAVLAAAELINRKLAEDKDIGSVVLQLNKMGTAVGQLMRQFGELKKSTPAGYMLAIERLAEKNNIKLNDIDKKKISKLLQAKTDLIKDLKETTDKRLDPNLSLDERKKLDKEVKKISNELYKVDSELNRFVQTKIPLKLTDALIQIMQGNLLTLGSLVVNIVGNITQLGLSLPIKLTASSFDYLRKFILGGERTTSFSIPAYWYGAKSFAKALPDAARILFWKGPRDDYNEMLKGEIDNGLLGIRAWMALMSKGGMPEVANMSKFDRLLSKISKDLGEKKYFAKADIFLSILAQGTFGIPADVMFRALQAGDVIFKRPYRDMSLYEIGKRKGLSGERLESVLKYPSKKELDMAEEIAKEGTFQEDSTLSSLSKEGVDFLSKWASKAPYVGNVLKLLVRSKFPYVKTPANIASFTFKMCVPEVAFAASAVYLSKGDNRKAALNFGIGVTGAMTSMVAAGLVANGLAQSMGDDDEPEVRGMKFAEFPPGTMNRSALSRVLDYIKEGYGKGGASEMGDRFNQFLTGDIPKSVTDVRPGEDEFVSYLKLGMPGFVLGVYAMEERDTVKDRAINAKKDDITKMLFTEAIRLPQSIRFVTQQSFLQGTADLMNLMTLKEDAVRDWSVNTVKTVSSIALPNQLASFARTQRDYLPDYRSDDAWTQIKNVLDDKIFFLRKETPMNQIRVDIWGRSIDQTPEGANRYMYHLGLDPLRKTKPSEDLVNSEILDLAVRTKSSIAYPKFINDVIKSYYRPTGKKEPFVLNKDQVNKLQRISGSINYDKVKNLILDGNDNVKLEWEFMDDETKLNKLSKIYSETKEDKEFEDEKKRILTDILLELGR
jgi:SHS2 domain-containing protein